jgi:hypothetical protein
MPMTLSGNGTITGLVAGGLPDATITGSDIAPSTIQGSNIASSTLTSDKLANSTITGAKLAPNAAVTNIGWTPPLYAFGSFNATTSGRVWCRCAYFNNSRQGYLVTINTNGGFYGPTSHSFIVMKIWTNQIYVTNLGAPAGTYATAVRMQGPSDDGAWYLEVQFDINSSQPEDAFRVGILALSHSAGDFLPQIGSYGTNAANLASTSASVSI